MRAIDSFVSSYVIDHVLGIHFLTYPRGTCVDFDIPHFEDFVVREVVDIPSVVNQREKRKENMHCLYLVKKVGLPTMDVAEKLKKILRCSELRYLGLKEARAIAYQYMVCEMCSECRERVEDVLWSASLVLCSTERIYIKHVGNEFELRLRCGDPHSAKLIEERLRGIRGILNYFGYQRFGSSRPITHLVGAAILRNDLESVTSLLCTRSTAWSKPPAFGYESRVCGYLLKRGCSIKVLKHLLGSKMIRLFVEAYQSYLFNKALSLTWMETLKDAGFDPYSALNTIKSLQCVCLGHDVELEGLGEPLRSCYEKVLDMEGLDFREARKLFARWRVRSCIRSCVIEPLIEELVVNNKNVFLRVLLPRGGYVTILLRELIPCRIEKVLSRH